MQVLGATLEMPFVTNVGGSDDGYRWSLVLPTREMRTVRLGDDDDFVLSPDDALALARASAIVRRAA